MATHLEVTKTGSSFADRATQSLLCARQLAPHAANGKPIRCQSARANYLLNEIGAGRMKPFHVLDEVFDAFEEMGIPSSEATAILDQWRAHREVRAVARWDRKHAEYPPLQLLPKVSLAETLAECKANPMQERMVTNVADVGALKAFRKVGGRHCDELVKLLHTVDRAILSVEDGGEKARIYGAKRPALELSR